MGWRAPGADLRLEDPGVWEAHLELQRQPLAGFFLSANPEALTHVNGKPVQGTVRLCNGDTIEAGGARLQFWLGPAVQTGLGLREGLTWGGLAGLTLAQIVLMYWLTN